MSQMKQKELTQQTQKHLHFIYTTSAQRLQSWPKIA